MRPSIVAVKVKADIRADRDNFTRANALTEYCAMPENKRGEEKCVAFCAFNFSERHPSLERIKDEFKFDMSKARLKNNELLAHWVISWKDGQPTPQEAIQAARELVADLGYGDNKVTIAIHADTDNTHAHICACKVDPWQEKIIREGNGWWKNEAQRSLARIAHAHDWRLEAGAKFVIPVNPQMEVIECHTPQGTQEITRPKVEKRKRDPNKPPSIRKRAREREQRTGVKSGQRLLQEVLAEFVAKHESEFGSWKVAHFHKHLAEAGISCERVQHGDRFGLVYSLDGENFEAASAVCPSLAYEPLLQRLNAKSWRDARPEIKKILEEARAARYTLPAPLPQEQEKMTYSKATLDLMRKIPTSQVFEALGMEPQEKTRTGRPLKTSFDACFLAGHTYAEAADFLAQKFPEVLNGSIKSEAVPVDEMMEAAKAQGINFGKMERSAKAVAEFMAALQITNMDVTTNVPFDLVKEYKEKGERLDNLHNAENLTFTQIASKLGILAKLNMAGKPGTHPVGIFCEPKWPQGKIGFLVDDVKPELLRKHKPTALLATSSESSQAFYIMPQRYPIPFYDWLAARVNKRYGDPAVTTTRHPTRLPGFQNQKREQPSWVRLKSWTREPCASMEELADRLYPEWEKASQYVKAIGNKTLSNVTNYENAYQLASREVWREIKAGKQHYTQAEIEKLIAERIKATDWETDGAIRHNLTDGLPAPKMPKSDLYCPPELEQIGLREQARLKARYGEQLDRSRADWMIAAKLYEAGAKIVQVYKWMLDHMTQKGKKNGEAERLRSEKEIERQARRLAVKQAPVSQLGTDSEFRKLFESKKPARASLDPLDTEREKKAELERLRAESRIRKPEQEQEKEKKPTIPQRQN